VDEELYLLIADVNRLLISVLILPSIAYGVVNYSYYKPSNCVQLVPVPLSPV